MYVGIFLLHDTYYYIIRIFCSFKSFRRLLSVRNKISVTDSTGWGVLAETGLYLASGTLSIQ